MSVSIRIRIFRIIWNVNVYEKNIYIYIFEDSKLDGIDQWDSLRTARESKRNEFIYNIDDFRPEIGGHAAIRYAGFRRYGTEPFK